VSKFTETQATCRMLRSLAAKYPVKIVNFVGKDFAEHVQKRRKEFIMDICAGEAASPKTFIAGDLILKHRQVAGMKYETEPEFAIQGDVKMNINTINKWMDYFNAQDRNRQLVANATAVAAAPKAVSTAPNKLAYTYYWFKRSTAGKQSFLHGAAKMARPTISLKSAANLCPLNQAREWFPSLGDTLDFIKANRRVSLRQGTHYYVMDGQGLCVAHAFPNSAREYEARTFAPCEIKPLLESDGVLPSGKTAAEPAKPKGAEAPPQKITVKPKYAVNMKGIYVGLFDTYDVWANLDEKSMTVVYGNRERDRKTYNKGDVAEVLNTKWAFLQPSDRAIAAAVEKRSIFND
jgi:hypothetical protein